MHLLKRFTAGSYKPIFFSLMRDARDVLTPDNKMHGKHGTVFFHEYIHYLQDLLTTFGVQNIIHLAAEYSIINNEIINAPSPLFDIPFVSGDQIFALRQEMNGLIWGTDEIANDEDNFDVISIYREPYTINQGIKADLISVQIRYRKSLEEDAFYLGAVHFLENLAHLLERSLTWEDNAPPFPYKVVEKVIRAIFSKGQFSNMNMVKFMEDALDAYSPAKYLMQFYAFCTQIGLGFTGEVIAMFKKGYRYQQGGQSLAVQKVYFKNAARARQGLDNLFNHEHLKELRDWGRHVISQAIQLKRQGFSFTQLLNEGVNQQKVMDKIDLLVKRVVSPVMMDRNYRIFYVPPKRSFENAMIYLLGLEAIIEILNGSLPCSMLNICHHEEMG